MYCKKCGIIIDDDSIFCSNCGANQKIVSNIYQEANQKFEKNLESKTVNLSLSFGNRSIPLNKSQNILKTSKYDTNYQRETGATIFGVFGFFFFTITFFIIVFSSNHLSSNSSIIPVISILELLYRFITTIWVVNIASRQNRDTIIWGIFSFFLPSLAAIIIGLKRKLKNENIVNPLSQKDQEAINSGIEKKISNSEDFLGSQMYWIILFGIPILVLLIYFLINRQ